MDSGPIHQMTSIQIGAKAEIQMEGQKNQSGNQNPQIVIADHIDEIVLRDDDVVKTCHQLFPQRNVILLVGVFDQSTKDLFFTKCRVIKSVKIYDLNKEIETQSNNSFVSIFSKEKLEEQIEECVIRNKGVIYYINQELHKLEDLRQNICTFQDEIDFKNNGVLEFERINNFEMATKMMPNFSSKKDSIKRQIHELNLNWILHSQINESDRDCFLQLVDEHEKKRYEILHNPKKSNEMVSEIKKGNFEKKYEAIKMYIQEAFLYKIINRGLRNLQSPEQITYIKYPVYHLYRQLQKLSLLQRQKGLFRKPFVCYRTCYLTNQEEQILTQSVGQEIVLEGFVSTSVSYMVAQGFGYHLLIINVPTKPQQEKQNPYFLHQNGFFADIKQFENQVQVEGGQEEILFSPHSHFIVKSFNRINGSLSSIQLQFMPSQVPTKNTESLQFKIKSQQQLMIGLGLLDRSTKCWKQNIIQKVQRSLQLQKFEAKEEKKQSEKIWLWFESMKLPKNTNMKEKLKDFAQMINPLDSMSIHRFGILRSTIDIHLCQAYGRPDKGLDSKLLLENLFKIDQKISQDTVRQFLLVIVKHIRSLNSNLTLLSRKISKRLCSLFLQPWDLNGIYYQFHSNNFKGIKQYFYNECLAVSPSQFAEWKNILSNLKSSEISRKQQNEQIQEVFCKHEKLFRYFLKSNENLEEVMRVFALAFQSINTEQDRQKFMAKYFVDAFTQQQRIPIETISNLFMLLCLLNNSIKGQKLFKMWKYKSQQIKHKSKQFECIDEFIKGLNYLSLQQYGCFVESLNKASEIAKQIYQEAISQDEKMQVRNVIIIISSTLEKVFPQKQEYKQQQQVYKQNCQIELWERTREQQCQIFKQIKSRNQFDRYTQRIEAYLEVPDKQKYLRKYYLLLANRMFDDKCYRVSAWILLKYIGNLTKDYFPPLADREEIAYMSEQIEQFGLEQFEEIEQKISLVMEQVYGYIQNEEE